MFIHSLALLIDLSQTAPVEEWSDEESGDIPFTDAPEEKKNKKDTNNMEEQEDDEEEDEEEGV